MRDKISLYIKPVYDEYAIIGWNWEYMKNGHIVAVSETHEPTISLAQEAGQARIALEEEKDGESDRST